APGAFPPPQALTSKTATAVAESIQPDLAIVMRLLTLFRKLTGPRAAGSDRARCPQAMRSPGGCQEIWPGKSTVREARRCSRASPRARVAASAHDEHDEDL